MSELSNQETFASFGNIIKEDDSTADFSIRCETREFRVHKVVLCARSSVFRAMILTDMQEASKGEIFIENLGERALISVIHFIYTGELELGDDPNIQDLAWAGTKYLLDGFMDLLALRLQMRKEEFPGEMIADLLIAAHLHEDKNLRRIALDKIWGNREIFNDPGFRKTMEESEPIVMIDLVKDL